MATRNTPFAPGTPCWVDLLSSDPDGAKAFYTELFGWTAEEAGNEFGNYVNFSSDGHKVAGMVRNNPESGSPDLWNTYLSTADIGATVAAATEAGGQVVVPAMQVGDLGSMAVLIDSAGGAVGLWQPGTHTGFQKYNEPGSVTWDEYHSKDFAASLAFYSSVFGWTTDVLSDTEDFRYYGWQIDGETVAGMMDSANFLPPEVPSIWTVYFAVADVDASCAKAVELGGTVVRPAETTPYGRIAELHDPSGTLFKLHTEVAEPTS
ncbi:MAG: VOC family protein [Actinomycetota bacterium]|nr:VOC family protein [Actinomycetota bacterium]